MLICRPPIKDESIQWAQFSSFPVLPIVLVALIGGFLVLDWRGHGFVVGWGRILEDLIGHPHRFDWGYCVLAQLYHELHDVVYNCGATLSV